MNTVISHSTILTLCTLFKFSIDKLAPIKNRVICNPFLARYFISVKVSEYCGKEELIYIATKKNRIK